MATRSPVCNPASLPGTSHERDGGFAASVRSVGPSLGLAKLGCRMIELDPGKKAWPYHLHHANEELFVILAGTGTLRYDGREYPVKAGDLIGAPAGPGTAHQIVNTSNAPLRYLAISTMLEPEVAEYPDSGKVMALAGTAPGGDPARKTVGAMFRAKDTVDYWFGEP